MMMMMMTTNGPLLLLLLLLSLSSFLTNCVPSFLQLDKFNLFAP